MRRDVVYEVADFAGVIEFVRYGLAVAILPPTGIDTGADVRLVPIRGLAPEFTISLAAPADRELGAPARALMEIALR